MHSQSDQYRRRAIQARHQAKQAIGHEARLAFDEIATHWLALAEQSDWLERYRPAVEQQRLSGPIGETTGAAVLGGRR